MKLYVKFYNRDFTERVQPPVSLNVELLRWNCIGGPDMATVTATGERRALGKLTEYLRRPVEIFDERARVVWWGMVNDGRYRRGRLESGASLSEMYNRVAVVYSNNEPGVNTSGEQRTTAWAADAASIAEYGYKELKSSQNDLTDTAAAAVRDSILAMRKYPQTVPGVESFGSPRGTVVRGGLLGREVSVTMNLVGWWSTLDWRYADQASTGLIETSTQISSLVTAYGQFLTGTDILNASGVYKASLLEGDTTALPEINALMRLGTTNGRRMLSRVTRGRRVELYEEPASSVVDYRMDTDGILWTAGGALVEPWRPPVGQWVRTNSILPETVDTSRMIDPALQFIEALEWGPGCGMRPQFRGQASIDDLLMARG